MMDNAKLSYNGLIDEAARFVEKMQLLDKPLWDKVIAVFDNGQFQKGWHGEYWGKLMRGGCIVYKYTENEALYCVLTDAVKGLLACQDEKGRITAYAEEFEFSNWDVWCRKYIMYGLMYYMDICKDDSFKAQILSALIRHADYIIERIGKEEGKKDITETSHYWLGANSSSILRPYVLLYKLTSDKKYLDFAEYIISTGGIQGGNLIELAAQDEIAPYQYPEVKAYETTSFFEGVFEYALLTNNAYLKDACIKYGNKILETDFTLIGATGCYDELFNNATKMQVTYIEKHMQETCVTVTVMEYMCRLLEYTGEAKYADAIETAFYNAFLGAINREYGNNDGLHFDSYSPILNNRRGLCVGGKQILLDGSYYGCCAAIGAAGFGAVTSMSAISDNDHLKISFYENGSIILGTTKLTVDTAYPFDGTIKVTVTEAEKPVKLLLRIPGWCQKYTVSLNGEAASGILENGYFAIAQPIYTADSVILALDMPFKTHHSEEFDPEVDSLFAITRGPIVFATENYGDHSFEEAQPISYQFEGISSSAYIKAASGEEIEISNYASVGMDWSKALTVWLKKK